ncbi:DUF2293 domain-containing protein [Mycolicibacterium sp. BiH015]|uniref:DUF2293 domain-containing protein n=1 Tax=Mycolicibacterium sp. BiH015 TaxID=3018808 RepID=UPI0022E641B0|nr:DUF2293 domain-containing protein [Mycolicibacterium sp. BiH015]MDA2891923.1 DUF2293 domain-containing protein [Mycolicibacterium sp. BiH015]
MTESLDQRVARIAQAILADRRFVAPIDVLIGLGWLDDTKVDVWRQGFVPSLDRCIRAKPVEVTDALKLLSTWAPARDLNPWATDYGTLAFTADRDPQTERASRIRWAATEDPEPSPTPPRPKQLKVFASWLVWFCANCGGIHDLILDDSGLCRDCAGLGHLVFLPSGAAALTRRTVKAAPTSAVVLRANTRNVRHGILADQRAIELAALQCLRDHQYLSEVGEQIRHDIADAIRTEFPGCPQSRADAIAYDAAVRRRNARSGATDPDYICEIVQDSVRRVDTEYDDLSLIGLDRVEAERKTQAQVDNVIDTWRSGIVLLDA